MSFKAVLFINDERRNILNASQMFSRFTDVNNKPTTKPVGGKLEFIIESTGNDSFFYYNMFSPIQKCKGEIVFYKRDGLSTLFKMEFANAQILNLSEHFDSNDNIPLHMNISIGWGIIRIRDVIFEEKWNPNNPFIEIEETVLENNNEEITEIYYEDLNGNKIENLKIGTDIYVVIKSENIIGENVDIDLNNSERDFKYKDVILEEDMLKNIMINSSSQKEKLTVIAQNH